MLSALALVILSAAKDLPTIRRINIAFTFLLENAPTSSIIYNIINDIVYDIIYDQPREEETCQK